MGNRMHFSRWFSRMVVLHSQSETSTAARADDQDGLLAECKRSDLGGVAGLRRPWRCVLRE